MLRMILVGALSLALSGCALLGDLAPRLERSVLQGGLSVTATVNNPVTRQQQASVEVAYATAGKAVLAYNRLPRCRTGQVETLVAPCSRWSVIVKLKNVNRVAYTAIRNLRGFMDTNQQISAISAFNAAQAALRDFRSIAYVEGVKIDTP